MTGSGTVVVGVGNAYGGDDGVALAVLEGLRAHVPEGVDLIPCEQEPSRLLDAWQDAEEAIVVDAVASGGEPGQLHRWDASENPVPTRVFHSSTHAFGVGETIELARALGRLPTRLVVYGIEGQTFDSSAKLSDKVAAAVDPAIAAILTEVQRFGEKEEICTSEH
jgi:hydrogenase maturation protease